MRLVPHSNKKIVSVVGLPHSGTTIVCNIINSMDNAFCLSEPHWAKLSKPGDVRYGKLNDLTIDNVENFMSRIQNALKNSAFHFGGVKETYRPFAEGMTQVFENIQKKSDVVIFVVREPLPHYNSLKAVTANTKRNPIPVDRMLSDHISLLNYINNTPNRVLIKIEDLCNEGDTGFIPYFNKISKELKIEGKFSLKPVDFIYGNHIANKSKNIKKPNMSQQHLSKSDIIYLQENVVPLYQQIISS
jgi:hypothetical protein